MALERPPHRAAPLIAAALVLATAAASPAAEPVTVRGPVAQIDLAGGQITVEPVTGRYVTLTASPDARLEIGGKPAELVAFDKGQWVRATYTADGTTNEVVRLRPALVTDEELVREVRRVRSATTGYTFRQKGAYEERWRELADGVDDRIARLLAEAKGAGREAKATIRVRVAALRYRRAELVERLSDVGSATADTWGEVKSETGAAAGELQRILGVPLKD